MYISWFPLRVKLNGQEQNTIRRMSFLVPHIIILPIKLSKVPFLSWCEKLTVRDLPINIKSSNTCVTGMGSAV
jgi:hypothetical protein